jgi:hypothetical protein
VLGAEAPRDGAVRPRDQDDLGLWQVGELGPVVLLGQDGHAEDE